MPVLKKSRTDWVLLMVGSPLLFAVWMGPLGLPWWSSPFMYMGLTGGALFARSFWPERRSPWDRLSPAAQQYLELVAAGVEGRVAIRVDGPALHPEQAIARNR